MVRPAVWITSLLACSALVLFAVHKGAADVAITSARRLFTEPDVANKEQGSAQEESPTSQLRGASPTNLNTPYEHWHRYYPAYEGSQGGRQDKSTQSGSSYWFQFVYGIVFYFLVASKYPQWHSANQQSAAIMNESTCLRIKTGPICLQTWFCQNPMLAHLLDATGSMNYWIALVLAMFFPCCLVCFTKADVTSKLGGIEKNIFTNCLESCFCSCCVIAQANEALDASTGVELGCCSVRAAAYRGDDGPYVAMPATGADPAQALRMPAPSAPPAGR